MAINKILPWAQTGTANVLSDDAYAADLATGGLYGDGVKTGQASSQQANKTWRQATAPGSGLGQFLVDNLSVDVTDSDTPATFSSRIANAVLKLSQISPFNQSWAVATGGYRKYAIVSDSSGNYWSSTADQNVTVPGASGANWQSLFNGYATQAWANNAFVQSQGAGIYKLSAATIDAGLGVPSFKDGAGVWHIVQPYGDYATNTALTQGLAGKQPVGDYATQAWANGQFLQLSNAAEQAVVGPVTFSGITKVPTPTDYSQNQAIGASDADARYARLSGGNTLTGNQEIVGDLGIEGQANSNVSGAYNDSTITIALAKRFGYSSVFGLREVVGQSLQAIISVFNGDSWSEFDFHHASSGGRITTPNGTVALTSELPTSGTITGGYYTKIGNVLTQTFSVSVSDQNTVTFPIAFSATPVPPQITIGERVDRDNAAYNVTATGFQVYIVGSGPVTITVSVTGV